MKPRILEFVVLGATMLAGLLTAIQASVFIFSPLGEFPLQTIESRVVGVEGPAVRVSDPVIVSAVKCARVRIPVRGTISLVRMDTGQREIVWSATGAAERSEGCQHFTFVNRLPQGIPPGIYRYEGIEEATYLGVLHQRVAWRTEFFRVVPDDR